MIKTLKISFEDLELVEIGGEHIKQFKRIDNACLDENGNIIETRKLLVVLDSRANKEYGKFSSERTIFDRITNFNDMSFLECMENNLKSGVKKILFLRPMKMTVLVIIKISIQ